MLEVIPVLTLWMCMPVDRRLPPVQEGDLGMFPGKAVAVRESQEARRHQFSHKQWRSYKWGNEGVREEREWLAIYQQAIHTSYAWDQLTGAYNSPSPTPWLRDLRRSIGVANYYAGQMPPQVYIPGMPPKKAGDK